MVAISFGMYFVLYLFNLFCNLSYNFLFCCPASRYNRVKKDQHDAQFILSVVRQPVHVSGVSKLTIRR